MGNAADCHLHAFPACLKPQKPFHDDNFFLSPFECALYDTVYERRAELKRGEEKRKILPGLYSPCPASTKRGKPPNRSQVNPNVALVFFQYRICLVQLLCGVILSPPLSLSPNENIPHRPGSDLYSAPCLPHTFTFGRSFVVRTCTCGPAPTFFWLLDPLFLLRFLISPALPIPSDNT